MELRAQLRLLSEFRAYRSGRRRTRRWRRDRLTTAPCASASATVGRLLPINAASSLGLSALPERSKINYGLMWPERANIVAKSLSADTMIIPLSTANAAIASSDAVSKP